MDLGEYLDETYTFHTEPMGGQFVRCEFCGADVSTEIGGIEMISHRHDCLRRSMAGRYVLD